MSIVRFLVLWAVSAVLTLLVGWWMIPVVAVVWGLVAPSSWWPGLTAGLAAAAAWGTLLAWSASVGPVGALAGKLDAISAAPGGTFIALTIVFPALLAAAAARVVSSIGKK